MGYHYHSSPAIHPTAYVEKLLFLTCRPIFCLQFFRKGGKEEKRKEVERKRGREEKGKKEKRKKGKKGKMEKGKREKKGRSKGVEEVRRKDMANNFRTQHFFCLDQFSKVWVIRTNDQIYSIEVRVSTFNRFLRHLSHKIPSLLPGTLNSLLYLFNEKPVILIIFNKAWSCWNGEKLLMLKHWKVSF